MKFLEFHPIKKKKKKKNIIIGETFQDKQIMPQDRTRANDQIFFCHKIEPATTNINLCNNTAKGGTSQ